MYMGIVGLILAFGCLLVFTWKGFSIYVVSLLSALLIMIFNQLPILQSLSEAYMPAMANFFRNYFIMFVLGSIMGRLYVESGAGVSIAKGVMSLVGKEKASDTSKHIAVILTVLVTGGLLGYGGVNVVAIPVALYPLILSLME